MPTVEIRNGAAVTEIILVVPQKIQNYHMSKRSSERMEKEMKWLM